jgi:putative ABC transport system permease protein
MFSVLNAVLLDPLAFRAFRHPERLAMIWEKNPSLSLFFANRMPVRMRNYREWKKQTQSFEGLAVWAPGSVTLTDSGGSKPEQVETGLASADFFPLLGVNIRLGRNFTPDEMQSAKVAILSDTLYKSRFNSDPSILDKTITADRKQYRVIGVLRPDFQMPAVWGGFDRKKPGIWMPINLHPGEQQDEANSNYVFGRLKPGVSLTHANAEFEVIAKRLIAAYPDRNTGFGVNITSVTTENAGPELRNALAVLQIAVAFVLLIACANVGNLSLTRAVSREKEMAVRAALGAGRKDIVRQMVTESILLSAIASGIGLVLCYWALQAITALAPTDLEALRELRIDTNVLSFTAALAVIAALLFGLAPMVHVLRKNLNEILARSSRIAGSSQRMRSFLSAAEIALSLVLLIGAGLMIRTLASLMNTDLGFRKDHLLIMRVTLPDEKYKNPEQVASFNNRLIEAVRRVPGVQSAALTNGLPMKQVNQSSFSLPGRTFPKGTMPTADWARTSDAYFETLGIRVIEGRTFTRDEASSNDPRVTVVNQAFASKFFPGDNPLDKTIDFDNGRGQSTPHRIVGVVADEHQLGPDGEQHPEFYMPASDLRSMLLVARTVPEPLSMASAVKQEVWKIEKGQPVAEVGTAETALREWVAPRRFNMIILANFAAIALVLAALGVYSVLAYSVTLRTREIGVRLALGAEPRNIARLVVRQGLKIVIAGIIVGMAGAFALTRFMQTLIFGITATDPVTFAGVAAILLIIAILASYVPAARAAKLDPMEALRVE